MDHASQSVARSEAARRSLSPLVRRAVVLCLVVKVTTWVLGYALAPRLDFDRANYLGNFAHYALDARALGRESARFLQLWSYSDSEWYLSIAATGYPSLAEIRRCGHRADLPEWSTERHCHAKYAFFPLYPALIAALASFLPLFVAAFVATAVIGLAAAACYVWAFALRLPERGNDAVAGLALLLLFPFSIFYQLYFTEPLFLLLSLLAFICLWAERYASMLACGALLALTRPIGVLIAIPLLVGLYRANREAPASAREVGVAVACALLVPAGLLPFAYLNFHQTGEWQYFSTVQAHWGYENRALLENLFRNLVWTGAQFPKLELHKFHSSQVEYVIMLAFGVVLVLMVRDRRFPVELTVWSLVLWLTPLVTKDLMSFGRYMSVSFPVFTYLAVTCRKETRLILIVLFTLGHLIALGGIVRYAWVG